MMRTIYTSLCVWRVRVFLRSVSAASVKNRARKPQLGVTESNLFSSAKERQGSGAARRRGCAIVSAAFHLL